MKQFVSVMMLGLLLAGATIPPGTPGLMSAGVEQVAGAWPGDHGCGQGGDLHLGECGED
jgi:hypothetical protein